MADRVTIAGGGLAGLAAGCGLVGRGVDVEVHEAGSYPRHRVCGEFVCGVGDEVLERLGIGGCFEGGVPLRTMTWFFRDRRVWTGTLAGRAVGISRHALDFRLARHLEGLGGLVRTDSRLEDCERGGLLWSAGRRATRGPWVGLKAHYDGLEPAADLEMHLGKLGYVGLSRIEGGRVNVCGLFAVGALRGKRKGPVLGEVCRLCGLGALADRLDGGRQVAGSACAVAGFRMGWQEPCRADACRARIGDAFTMIPPFTGNGMSMALESAHEAAEVFASGGRERGNICAELRGRLFRRFARRVRLARFLHPFLLHTPGQILLASCARSRLLPVKTLFRAVR
jgi:menaquinone-9 beta-reductase